MPDAPATPPPPAFPRPGRLRRLDGRVKLAALIAACFITQYAPGPLLPIWLCLLACLFALREMRSAGVRTMIRGGIYFTLFWYAMKMGSDLIAGTAAGAAALAALPLAGRLLALTCIGAAVVGLASPVEIGKAAAWCIRPVAGDAAWKPALLVALTAWFLPLNLRLAGDVLAAAKARGLKLSRRRKFFLVVGAALRILDRKASELALGLASRRLDDPRAWRLDPVRIDDAPAPGRPPG